MAIMVNSRESFSAKPRAANSAAAACARGPPVWLRMPCMVMLVTELPMKFSTFFWNAATDT